MGLNVKELSVLELIEALDAYPQDTHPREYCALSAEIASRKADAQKDNTGKTSPASSAGQRFLETWPRKKTVIQLVSVILIGIIAFQYLFLARPIHVVLVFIGMVVNSYIFNVLIVDKNLKNANVVDAVANSVSLKEAMKILKGPFYFRIIAVLIFVLLGSIYVIFS